MQFRKEIILACGILLFLAKVNAQSSWHFAAKVSVTNSNFAFNKSSTIYSSKWDKVDVAFVPKIGFAISAEIEKHIYKKWSITGAIKYSKWGGKINSTMRAYALNEFDMDINYQSILIPVCLKYFFCNKNKTSFHVFGGYAYCNTFDLNYVAKTNFGTAQPINEKMDLTTGVLCFGIGAEYKITNKIYGLLSLEVNNDMLLNNNRKQNYQGINGFDYIPINYNLFEINFGIKI